MSFDPTKYTKSRWLKGSDLPAGQQTTVTIEMAFEHTFEQSNETKPALKFLDFDQDLALNKTQVTAMINAFGPNPDAWKNRRIHLQPVASQFAGKPTILITPAAAPAAAQQTPAVQWEDADQVPADDDVPF